MSAAISTALDDIVRSFDAKTACALPCNALAVMKRTVHLHCRANDGPAAILLYAWAGLQSAHGNF